VGIEGSICPDDSPFYCFRTDVLSFAVPKQFSDSTASWEDDGVTYSVAERSSEVFLGQEFEAYFIRRSRDGSTHEFMFSRERGLLAIMFRDGELAQQLLSIEYCGFGASPSCRSP
jgi:hypothetical protein